MSTQQSASSEFITDQAIEAAAQRLLEGRLVAFPTETVYGLGANALNPDAIARVYAVKGRPANHPVIVHLAPGAELSFWARTMTRQAQELITAFWPGPLTLILPRSAHVPDAVTGGQDTVGLRCPAHPVAQALLTAFAARMPGGHGGVVAPSANRFGHVSPTRAEHVQSEFSNLSAADLLILPGGAADIGIESTILDVSRLDTDGAPTLLRPGHITPAQIAQVLGCAVRAADATAPRVSGSLKAHYAPRTRLEIASASALRALQEQPADAPVAVLVFQSIDTMPKGYVQWQASSDPVLYAQGLYQLLRDLDQSGYGRIVLQAPPDDAAWHAVRDRIGRAAAAFHA